MIEIRARSYEDPQYDLCGNTTNAVLTINNIKIPLCNECIEELTQSLNEFNNVIFCHKCKYYIKNLHDDTICTNRAIPVNPMDTCSRVKLK